MSLNFPVTYTFGSNSYDSIPTTCCGDEYLHKFNLGTEFSVTTFQSLNLLQYSTVTNIIFMSIQEIYPPSPWVLDKIASVNRSV